jgi:hypothetical protein
VVGVTRVSELWEDAGGALSASTGRPQAARHIVNKKNRNLLRIVVSTNAAMQLKLRLEVLAVVRGW